jgi:hypothetical protein
MVTLAKMSSHAAESGSPSEYMAFIRRQPPGVGVLPAAQDLLADAAPAELLTALLISLATSAASAAP